MKRITTDNVWEMGIVGLAHNCCYIGKDGCARYRDFDMDIDARELAKELLKELANQDVDFESDEDFDEWIGSCYGEDGIGTIHGLIAMFYQNIWAMAELRENLKRYEDLEEQKEGKGAHFRATESNGSAGIVGLSVNEAKRFMEG